MKAAKYILILFLFVSITSCGDTSLKKDSTEPPPVYAEQLFDLRLMLEKGWKNISFPMWISPEKVDSLNIDRFTITFVNYNVSDSLINVSDTLPYKTITVSFGKKGKIENVTMADFNIGRKIAEHIFTYPKSIDSNGYSLPYVALKSDIKNNKNPLSPIISTLQDLLEYQRLVFKESTEDYLIYKNEVSLDDVNHYFITDSSKWNISFLDKEIKPSSEDIIYFGAPNNYISAFSIQNMVEKTMIESFDLYSNNVLKSQNLYEDGFVTQRWFNYDKNGLCTGFIDSLCTSSDDFIHASIGKIGYQDGLLKSITFFNEKDLEFDQPTKVIRFTYDIAE